MDDHDSTMHIAQYPDDRDGRRRVQIAVGMNGRVWVNSPSPKVTILVSNAIVKAEFLSRPQVSLLVAKILDANPDLPRHDNS